MYRSASTNRVSDDHHYGSSSSSASSKVSAALRALSLEVNHELPVFNNNNHNNNNYESESEAAKKERYRAKFAENAVHLIPLILLSCAFILWFLCNPDIDVPTTIAAKTAATIEGDVDSDGTQTGNMPLELGDSSKLDGDRTTFFSSRTKLP